MTDANITDLIGKTIIKTNDLTKDSESVIFYTDDDITFVFEHDQSCREHVSIDDICGDIEDLIGSPLLIAEEVISDEEHPTDPFSQNKLNPPEEYSPDSCTWTFYKFATIKGSVTIRWYGSSNGYYSERVDLKSYPTKDTANG